MGCSRENIIRMVKEEDVKFIRMQFTDIFGQLKNVAITASQIEKAVDNRKRQIVGHLPPWCRIGARG